METAKNITQLAYHRGVGRESGTLGKFLPLRNMFKKLKSKFLINNSQGGQQHGKTCKKN